MTMYRGIVTDRLGEHGDYITRLHPTFEAAHTAAERICKKYFPGDRGAIDVVAVEVAK